MAAFSVTEAMVSWLSSMGYRASTRVPKDPPAEFLTVERVGGGPSSMVDRASMALQAWAATDAEAEVLANESRLSLLTSSPPPGVHSVRVERGPYQLFDPETRRARYQTVLDVSCQLEI